MKKEKNNNDKKKKKSTDLLFQGKWATAPETGVSAYETLGHKRLDVLCNVTGETSFGLRDKGTRISI